MRELWILFYTFVRIGAFTFGGGYAMLPILQKEIIDKHGWATEEEIMDYYAVGQCTPGVIAVNTSTFIGYKQKGIMGGIVATLGMIFPSLVIIMLIASFLKGFSSLTMVQHAFAGIRVVVAVLVVNVVIKMLKTSVKDWISLILFIFTLLIGLFFSLSPIYMIVASGLIGIIANKLGGAKKI